MAEKLNPPMPAPTDGVIAIRPFRAEDAPAVTAACQDPQVARWIPLIPVPYAESDAKVFILLSLKAWTDGSSYEFAIVDAATDEYVGSVGIHSGPTPKRFAVGYLVAPNKRSHGIATRAVNLAVRWAFESLAIERLQLWTLPGNVASQRVAEKAGFRFEGLIRNWDSGRDGDPIDVVMFSMTPEDFAEIDESTAALMDARLARYPRELHAVGSRTAPFIDLLNVSEIQPGSMRRVTIADLDLLVAWTDSGIAVTDDRCPHMSAPLSIGRLDGCVVSCPLHEGRFDLDTGETVQMPTTGGLDADGEYHGPWSPTAAEPKPAAKPEPPSKKLDARRLTRVHRLRYYPARIRAGRLEAQIPFVVE